MNSFIETLNHSGGTFLDFAWPIAWQSGLLVAALLAFDFLFRRRVRASVRYAVWLVVLVKLILPPTLALPTSPAWWLLHQPPVIQIKPQMQNYTVSYDDESLPPDSLNPLPAYVPPTPVMTYAAWLLVLSAATSTGLLAWLLLRWWQITRRVSRAKTSERLTNIAAQTRLLAGVRACPPVKLTADTMSPAVCGLFRPAILIPQTLAENFSDEQLRAVLLHELIHLRRRDVWLNFVQSLLQIVYWWHPLVWLANARIRRVREEAVDDAVMLALAGGAEAYAPTLLQVARLALNRPLVSLGLVGIMESRSALRQRIERLVDFRPPRRAGLTLVSLFGILAFTAVAVPMGGAPGATEEQVLPAPVVPVPTVAAPDTNPPPILIEAQIYQLRAVDFEKAVSGLKCNQSGQNNNSWWSASPAKFNQLSEDLRASGLKPVSRPRVLTRSGWPAEFYVGNDTNSLKFDCLPLVTNGLIELAGQGFAVAKSASISITNQFSVKTVMEDRGGMVVRMNNADGSIESDVFMVTIGVQMVTDTARYQQRLEPIIKKKQPSADDIVKAVSLVAAGQSKFQSTGPQKFLQSPETVTGIVSNTNFSAALHELQKRSGVKELPEPEAVARSGRYANWLGGVSMPLASEDSAESSSQTNPAAQLFARTFKVDTQTFIASLGLKLSPADFGENSPAAVGPALRKFVTDLGVNLESPSGKTIFFNDKLGLLYVKATESDLDTIGRSLQTLNMVGPQIHIKARFIEVPKGTFAGLANMIIVTNQPNQLIGVLTSGDFQVALRGLQTRSEELAEPEAVTLSGRQTQMRATEVINVVTNFFLKEMGTNVAIMPQTGQAETGPFLDTIPYVLSDGYTINLTTVVSVTRFLGYSSPTNTKTAFTSSGEKVSLPSILPVFDTHQAHASLNLWDDQTLVMEAIDPSPFQGSIDSDVPMLDDLRPIGDVVRNPGKTSPPKELLVFVTVTLVDPAGNRVHSEDELPFAETEIPPQPPQPNQSDSSLIIP